MIDIFNKNKAQIVRKLQPFFKLILNLCFTRKNRSKSGVIADIILLVFVFTGAFFTATNYFDYYYKNGGAVYWYQESAGPAVSMAYGKGFKNPIDPNPNGALSKFLNEGWKDLSFDKLRPEEKPAVFSEKINMLQQAHQYMYMTVGLWWRITGQISWTGTIPLFGIFYGVSCLFAYLIFRLGMGRLLSLGCVSAYALFGPALAQVPFFRDFSRAPFILALCYLLCLMVAIPFKSRNIVILSVFAGVVAGISMGFRTDLIAMVPLVFAAIFFFSRTGVFKNLKKKLVAGILFLFIFTVFSWPIWKSTMGDHTQSAFTHILLLGFMEPNNETMQVTSDRYNWGLTIADMYAFTLAGSQAYHRHHKIVHYLSKEYKVATVECITDIVRNFPADMLTRAYASVINLHYIPYNPYIFDFAARSLLNKGHPAILKAIQIRDRIMFSKYNIGFICAILALLVISFFDLKIAFFLLAAGVVVLGYPIIQFQGRHFFMLSFVGLWTVGFMLHFIGRLTMLLLKWSRFKRLLTRFEWAKPWQNRHVRGTGWLVASVVVFFITPWLVVAEYQNHHLHKMFYEKILSMEKQQLELKLEPYYQPHLILITSPELAPDIIKKGLPSDMPFYSEFILIEFDCNSLENDVKTGTGILYHSGIRTGDVNNTKDFSKIKLLEFKKGERKALIMPAYYTDKSNFHGLLLEKQYQGIVKGIYKFSNPQQMPVSVMAFLPLNYRDEFLLQSLSLTYN